ncbi:hypothetical protein L207DRAFT_169919 [Hyaloscypha variabilis F]|uniref:Uncharacterized protein n=1 Tax=Hyaloscypha variabilis (strain UAMH 11265 / GT02V1 / F) TaxID=1149755 RepID=A0A2J6R496_HYAVF|nr:hypothetical protein L207DRAFT_169919 [Hyaloscypha variabilis F]
MLGLGTAHLNCLVKLTELERLGARYCQTACIGLQNALVDFSPENSDAVLATSILLGWQARDKITYGKFAQGTAHVLSLMRPWNDESKLIELVGPVPPLSGRMKESLLMYSTISDESLSSLKPLSEALMKLQSELGDGTELRKAAHTFGVYVQNLRDLPPGSPLADQISLLFPVRTFLPMVPSRFLGMGTRDIWALVIMAYFHVILVATAAKFPETATSLFAVKRTEIILRIDNELHSINTKTSDAGKSWELEKGMAMMRLPMLYVVDYRFRYCVLKE